MASLPPVTYAFEPLEEDCEPESFNLAMNNRLWDQVPSYRACHNVLCNFRYSGAGTVQFLVHLPTKGNSLLLVLSNVTNKRENIRCQWTTPLQQSNETQTVFLRYSLFVNR
jgi:hypothetical protein